MLYMYVLLLYIYMTARLQEANRTTHGFHCNDIQTSKQQELWEEGAGDR